MLHVSRGAKLSTRTSSARVTSLAFYVMHDSRELAAPPFRAASPLRRATIERWPWASRGGYDLLTKMIRGATPPPATEYARGLALIESAISPLQRRLLLAH